MDIDIKVDGLNEIHKQLMKLDVETNIKALNSALVAAAKPTLNRAKRNVSFSSNLVNSLKIKRHRTFNKRKGKANIAKGFRKASSGSNRVTGASIQVDFKKAPHFHLLELGTKDRKNKRGANRGRVSPRNYLGNAFSGGAPDEALEIFKKRMQIRLKRLVKQGKL